MRPSWTKVEWPPTTPLVSLADARAWIGLYGDTSLDSEVQVCLDAAVEKIADNVGYRVSDTGITDYYPSSASRELTLSEPGVDTSTLALKYYRGTTLVTLADSTWRIDPTTEENTLVWEDGNFPSDVSSEVALPIQVSYNSHLESVRGTISRERLVYAVRVAAEWFWRSRGTAQDPYHLDRTLTTVLQSARLSPVG